VSGNSVRRNTLPSAPTGFTASPAVYNSGAVTLAWSGAAGGTSAIKNYVLQVATSTDNSTWGAYSNLATVNAPASSYEYTPSAMASFTRYRVCVTDALDCVSGFTASGVVRKNNPPRPPLLYAPKNNSVTFNRRPRVLMTVSTEPDGEPQTVFIIMNGIVQNSVDDSGHFSTVGALKGGVNTIFTHDELSPGEHQITIHTSDGGANSGTVVRSFTVAESPFEEVTANVTPVKAAHMLSLRSAVNAVRDYYGLAAYAWVREIISGKTEIEDWGWHILELRSAVEAVIHKINSFDPKGAIPPFDWLPLGTGRPRADVMDQLQSIILNL
jgi:hypothetical protein